MNELAKEHEDSIKKMEEKMNKLKTENLLLLEQTKQSSKVEGTEEDADNFG